MDYLFISQDSIYKRQKPCQLFEQREFHIKSYWGFPGGAVVRNLPANAGDTGSCPGPGRSHMPRSG